MAFIHDLTFKVCYKNHDISFIKDRLASIRKRMQVLIIEIAYIQMRLTTILHFNMFPVKKKKFI